MRTLAEEIKKTRVEEAAKPRNGLVIALCCIMDLVTARISDCGGARVDVLLSLLPGAECAARLREIRR